VKGRVGPARTRARCESILRKSHVRQAVRAATLTYSERPAVTLPIANRRNTRGNSDAENDGVECRAFRRFGPGTCRGTSRRLSVQARPETPHRPRFRVYGAKSPGFENVAAPNC
jgi:hypothetical protein